MDYSELREYTHGFFSNVAEILGDGFVKVDIFLSFVTYLFILEVHTEIGGYFP